MSFHTARAKKLAASKGGLAGMKENAWLWELSKRELVEVALRFQERLGEGAIKGELDALKANGII
jgi:hypothetical protein